MSGSGNICRHEGAPSATDRRCRNAWTPDDPSGSSRGAHNYTQWADACCAFALWAAPHARRSPHTAFVYQAYRAQAGCISQPPPVKPYQLT